MALSISESKHNHNLSNQSNSNNKDMKKLLPLVPLLFIGLNLQAQYYKNSVGIRTGYTSAVTYKHFFENEQSIEVLASGRNNGFQATTLYQFNKPMPIGFNDRFYAYYGIGASAGYERFSTRLTDVNSPTPPFTFDRQTYFTMGINTILGVEYRWLSIPMTIGLDIKPLFQFIGMQYTETHFWDVGLSAKYVF